MDKSTKDFMDLKKIGGDDERERRFSDASDTSMDCHMESIGSRRRDSLIEQFRDFLNRSMDFSVKIDDPFEKEMY
ncbi:Ovule protein [Caenorhabditis elegans]|uniref:Ovule protein n=1 Tax=Caenorhabditis elegans TaxID=6239 RepID=Q9GYG2_CAEEL|nr:Ovule protein [Caenorhabditis elegans]CCD66663.1 Ovule protein [Caenorhabditis elegans]|eukprot:NP_498123.1 Uncharacterized protein CELE_ZC395.5 [Caenorhabditis elegans]